MSYVWKDGSSSLLKNLISLSFLLVLACPALAQTYDQYHGLSGGAQSLNPNSGHFRLEKMGTGNNYWTLVDPDNNAMVMFGVYVVGTGDGGTRYTDAVKAKYGNTTTAFCKQAASRMLTWNFNTMGEYHSSYCTPAPLYGISHENSVKLPFLHLINSNLGSVQGSAVKNIVLGTDPTVYTGYRGGTLPDVFDPAYAAYVDGAFKSWMSTWTVPSKGGADPTTFPWLISLTTDDGDGIYGFRRGSNTNGAWLAAATAPRQARSSHRVEFSDTTVYTKSAWVSFLQAKYLNSLANLNAAWGSNYTSWGSTQCAWNKVKVTLEADGITAYLPHIPVVASSVTVTDTNYNPLTISSINGISGKIVLSAPSPTAYIYASYMGDSWPKHLSGGTGLLDEDGSSVWMHPSNRDYALLSGLPAQVHADLNDFLASPNAIDTNRLVNHYASTVTHSAKAHFPYTLVSGPAPILADIMSRTDGSGKLIMQAFAAYYDWLQVNATVAEIPIRGGTNNYVQELYDVTHKPLYVYLLMSAYADSPLSAYSSPNPVTDNPTQANRGEMYSDVVNYLFGMAGSDGIHPVVGIDWWEWTDKVVGGEHTEAGLVTNLDNAYDGVEDQIPTGVDQWGYKVGGEAASYGDFLEVVKSTNQDIQTQQLYNFTH
jgi:hypothetical protein